MGDGNVPMTLIATAQLAERDAEIVALRQQVDAWQATGNAIMQCAVGREAPLSDSDVCGEINALRQQVAELQAWKDAVPVVGIKRLFRDAPYDASYADEVWQWIEKYTLNR